MKKGHLINPWLLCLVTFFLYNVQAQTLEQALDTTGLTWTTNGNAGWIGQTGVNYDGSDAAASGVITHNQESGMETTVTNGPGTLSFWWKVVSEQGGDFLEFYLNGVLQDRISGSVDWQFRTYDIPAGNQILRWRYVKNGTINVGTPPSGDRGWVDQVIYTTTPPLSLGQALDTSSLIWTSGGNTNTTLWTGLTNLVVLGGITNLAHDGVDSAQSGAIYHNQESWMETTVSGATNVTFWWKVSSEAGSDFLQFLVNGVLKTNISGEVAWRQQSFALATNSQTLRWRYVKDFISTVGQDRGWVDQVVITPTRPTLSSIAVTPSSPTILFGGTQQFTATGTYSDSSTQNLTSSAAWISTNTNVATINASGLATSAAVGNTTISATLFGVTGSTTLTIAKSNAVVTLGNLSQGYDGGGKSASAGTVPAGLTVNLTYGGSGSAPTNAGSYQVIGTVVDANYSGAATNTLVVSKAVLTVTADDHSRAYGEANPTLTVSYTGFVNNEILPTSGVTGTPDLSTTATNNSPEGNYPITAELGSLSALNYSFSFVGGTLAVVAERPTILSIAVVGSTNFVLNWSAISNVTYRVQYQSDLSTTNWLDLAPDVTATTNTASAIDNPSGAVQRFYRIQIVP